MEILLKAILFGILFIPFLILTGLVWLFGGWTQEYDMSPNPLYWLFDKLLD